MDLNSREWFYLGGVQVPDRKGPVPAQILIRLLEKGVGVSPQSLVWKNGMETWLPLEQVEPFAKTARFLSKQWYYLDEDRAQQGPISSQLLLHKLKNGGIDGLTMVFSAGTTTEWCSVGDVPELKEVMAKIAMEEEAAEAAAAQSADQARELQQQQVFVEDDVSELYQKARENPEEKKNLTSIPSKKAHKSFIADNGLRYAWDEAEQDWIEAEGMGGEEEDDDDDDEEEEEVHVAGDDEEDVGDDDRRALGALAHGKMTIGVKRVANLDNASEMDACDRVGAEGDKTGVEPPKKKRKAKKKNKKSMKNWVYVTGLPADITVEEINAHFSKVGILELSPYDQLPKIKIYRDETTGDCKGDCSLCYNAEDSVKMALEVLHEGYIRPSHKITVSKADFSTSAAGSAVGGMQNSEADGTTGTRGAQQPAGVEARQRQRSRPQLSQAQMKVAKSAMKQALAWNEDDDMGIVKSKALKIVVLEGMFVPSDFEDDGTFERELEADIVAGCEQCGPIEKVTLFSKNTRGIIIVKFFTSYAAQECIKVMNGRFYGGRRVKSYYWDGTTDFSITSESVKDAEKEEREEEARIEEYGKWLEQQQEELPEEFALKTE